MNTANTQSHKESSSIVTHAIVALLVTLFLFFIDEGYYDFRWMNSFGNWLCFVIYSVFLFGGQLLLRAFVFKKLTRTHAVLASVIGVFIGFILVVMCIFND